MATQSRLERPEQFENIILRTNSDGSVVYLRDVARVEIGAENYQNQTTLNGYPSAGISIQLASGANALETAEKFGPKSNASLPAFRKAWSPPIRATAHRL